MYTNKELVEKYSTKVKTNAIIWLIIGIIQVCSMVTIVVGVLNIISATNGLKHSKAVLERPVGIANRVRPLAMPIIVLTYNLLFGGIIGVIGSIYYFVAIREFVLDREKEFAEIEESYNQN